MLLSNFQLLQIQTGSGFLLLQVQDFGYGLLSDLNGDCHVDFQDLAIFAEYWLTSDDNIDGLATFVGQWLENNDLQIH
jgi:hypothetical protein